MAAAFARRHGGVTVLSAGSDPGARLHPVVVDAMDEVGLDIHDEQPTALTEAMAHTADVVVTMGCGDACPVLPGKRYVDWELADPAGQPLEVVRAIRDEIEVRVDDLIGELLRSDAVGTDST